MPPRKKRLIERSSIDPAPKKKRTVSSRPAKIFAAASKKRLVSAARKTRRPKPAEPSSVADEPVMMTDPAATPAQNESDGAPDYIAETQSWPEPHVAFEPRRAYLPASRPPARRHRFNLIASIILAAAAVACTAFFGGVIVNAVNAAYQGPTQAAPGGNIPITIWNRNASTGTQSPASIEIDGKIQTAGNIFTTGTGSITAAGTLTGSGMSVFGASTLITGAGQNLIWGDMSASSTGNLMLLQTVSAGPTYADKFKVDRFGNVTIAGSITGSGAGLTNLPAGSMSGTVGVANGGTGIAATTAYGVLTGGTTAAGAFQNAGTGSAGQVLTSGGAASLPTWQTVTVSNLGGGAAGQVPYQSAPGTTAFTAAGAAGQFLTSNGAGAPTWTNGSSSTTTTGTLTSGSIAPGFGSISTTNPITTTNNISTTGSGTITSAGAFAANNTSTFGSPALVVGAGQNLIYGDIASTSAGNLMLLQTVAGGVYTDRFKIDAGGNVTANSFVGNGAGLTNLNPANLSAPVAIANGGTGQTTAISAFKALSPLTAKGDLVSYDGANDVRVAVGTNGQVLTADNTFAAGLKWMTPVTSQWTTSGSDIYYNAGKVGIGTATPGGGATDYPGTLHVKGASASDASHWSGRVIASGPTNAVVLGEFNGVATLGAHVAALNAWANLIINPGGGNVGIGTTAPASKLTVSGSGVWDGAAFELNNTGTSGRRWTIFSTNTSFTQGAGRLLFYNSTSNSDAMVIDPSNIVGIGTNNPGAGTSNTSTKLELYGPDAIVRVRNSNDSIGGFIGDSYGIMQFGMYNPTGGAVGQIASLATRSFFGVGNDGKVGSMTNNFGSPTYRNLLDDGAGNVVIEGGSTDKSLSVGLGATFGRNLTISAGQGAAGNGGGSLYLLSGADGSASSSGAVTIKSANAHAGQSGFVQITTGDIQAAGASVGSITIDPGNPYGVSNKGQVFIGNTYASNVEIGSTTGAGVLIKTPAYSYTERVCHGGATGNGVAFSGYLSDCAAAGQADYAELYPMKTDVQYGDIVVASADSVKTKDGDKVPVLEKSSGGYARGVFGVASDNHGDPSSIGYNINDKDNPVPLALNGRVPTKVSAENGPIQVGDPITTSSRPGVGMKATRPGMIIGYALNSWSGAGVGKINVFINTEYYLGGMFDEHGGVSGEFKAALSLWGASSGWLDCPVTGDCSCPNGYFVTDIRDRGKAIQCHQL